MSSLLAKLFPSIVGPEAKLAKARRFLESGDFSEARWQDKVFVVPPEDVPTGIAQILPQHPMTAAAGRLAQKQAAKAVRQAARQAARDAARAANEPGPSAIEMQIQAAAEQVHVEEPMDVINIPEFDRVDDLLDEYSDLLYGDEPLTGEALLDQQEFLQKTLTEVSAVDDPVELSLIHISEPTRPY